ncbi:MAG: tetratricopeptide repeat protein [Bacteroidia bacterium]|nr:tetratricopeptide repeat protein [Bacteroidia bacterium]
MKIGLLLLMLTSYCSLTSGPADSLLRIIRAGKKDTGTVIACTQYARHLAIKGKFDSALYYGTLAANLSRSLKYMRGLAGALNNRGVVYWYKGEYPKALNELKASLIIRKKLRDLKNCGAVYNNIAMVMQDMGNYPDALENHLIGLRYREKCADTAGMAFSHNNISLIYQAQKEYSNAIAELEKAENLFRKTNDLNGLANVYNNLGVIYKMLEKYEDALRMYKLSLKLVEETGNRKEQGNTMNNIGTLYMGWAGKDSIQKKMHYTLAEMHLKSSLRIREGTGDQNGIASSHYNIGNLLIKMGKYADARSHIEKGLEIGLNISSKMVIRESYSGLAFLDSLQGNYRSALRNYMLFIAFRDSMNNEENTRKQVQQEMRYDFEKEQQADSIRQAAEVAKREMSHQQELKQQRWYIYGGITGFLLMLSVAAISFRAYRQKQRDNRIIAKQKELVEEKQKEILDSIHYARRIQRSLLPSEKYIQSRMKK